MKKTVSASLHNSNKYSNSNEEEIVIDLLFEIGNVSMSIKLHFQLTCKTYYKYVILQLNYNSPTIYIFYLVLSLVYKTFYQYQNLLEVNFQKINNNNNKAVMIH